MIGFTIDGDRVVVDADGTERSVIDDLAHQLDEMLAARAEATSAWDGAGGRPTPDDPALARLLPDMITGDEDAARELRGLVEPSLLATKREQLRLVRRSLEHPGALDHETEEAWMRVLTDLRLTIGARLGLDDADDADDHADRHTTTDAERTLLEVADWLGGVLEHLIATLDRRDERQEIA